MNKLLVLLFLFFIGSIIGWIIELFFRRFYSPNGRKYKKWVNPGFLTGPYLPLYGFGLCTLYLLGGLNFDMIIHNKIISNAMVFIVMALAMTGIEFIAGLIFVKGMHIKLWDYSDEWLNIKGIICPRFSFFWAVLGAVYYLIIHPYILEALSWLADNLAFSFVIGFFYGIFAIDLCYTFNIMVRIKKFADEKEIIVKLELLKYQLSEARDEWKEKHKFLFSFSTSRPLSEIFDLYNDKYSVIKIGRHKKSDKHTKTKRKKSRNDG